MTLLFQGDKQVPGQSMIYYVIGHLKKNKL